MFQGFCEIGKALVRFIGLVALLFVAVVGLYLGLYFTWGWILRHIAIHWK